MTHVNQTLAPAVSSSPPQGPPRPHPLAGSLNPRCPECAAHRAELAARSEDLAARSEAAASGWRARSAAWYMAVSLRMAEAHAIVAHGYTDPAWEENKGQ
jgi:hypothetical protein